MEQEWIIDALRVGIAFVVLAYASFKDLRERRVPNAPWIILAIIGLVLLPVQISADESSLEYALVVVPVLAILTDVYWDGREGSWAARYGPYMKYAIAIAAVIVLGYAWGTNSYFQYLLAVPIMMLFIVVLYMTDVIRGGADAKALLSLAILFPRYPSLGDLPWLDAAGGAGQLLFPFSLVILINAAIITALMALVFLAKNIAAGDRRFPQAFLGYRMETSRLKGKHVWLMERIENGTHSIYSRPRSEEDLEREVALLNQAGLTKVWITPKIPFIVPMLASLIFSAVVGNLLFLLTSY